MSIMPRRRKKAGFTRTRAADERTTASDFLIDHGCDRDHEDYIVWVNRRLVGPDVVIEPSDSVTISPRSIRKIRPLSATRPRVARPSKKDELIAMLDEWRKEAEDATDGEKRVASEAFEEFKRAINETRAQAGARILYP